MQSIIKIANNIMQFLLSLDSAVLVPIFLFILALALGAKFKKALRSALTVGVGFVGIFTLTNLFFSELAPAAEAMVQRWNLSLNVIDVGWGPYMGSIWASPISLLMLPLFIVINIVLLVIKQTDTLDIDLWNYALCFYAGMLTYVSTGHNIVLTLIAFAISVFITLKLADLTAPKMQEFFGLPGISFPHVVSLSFLPIGYVLSKLLDKIPFIRDLDWDEETLHKKFGIFGEPIFMGFAIGLIIGLLAGQSFADALSLGVTMAAVMVLLPRMVSVLVEGLVPLNETIREKFQKWMPGRNINIGLDTAIVIGNPTTLTASIMLVPVALVLAAILPYNRVIPFADLSSITFAICLITPYVNGNIVKLFIIGTLIIALVMLPLSTLVAPDITRIVQEANMFDLPEGFSQANMVTAFLDGSNPISFIIYKLVSLFN
ncbi:PTS galactitol transporter subunit IIC [Paratissierella segnis]|jgi:PTS system galactitol-specific IIC component|uniref:PTS galactitol transporter subunit IIC n=1 Tax=Paratissierella segnis TaxID=2763679 RepID=A0A926IJF8_9FIRM|nr:PTS transporter subunit IIC [Paratissierella segnis]MBC8587984.1 PTS galactitol transporter subunit IIC [Paratissierella segnis]